MMTDLSFLCLFLCVCMNFRADGFFWYDTGQEHIITSSVFRHCGFRSDAYDQYDSSETRGCGSNPYNGCGGGSTVFGFLTHSDQFNPELMQATRDLSFNEVGRRFKFTTTNFETVSGRAQNWLDVDGTVSGFGEPTLIGSGFESAGLWWRVGKQDFLFFFFLFFWRVSQSKHFCDFLQTVMFF